jgi:hypothetical protein
MFSMEESLKLEIGRGETLFLRDPSKIESLSLESFEELERVKEVGNFRIFDFLRFNSSYFVEVLKNELKLSVKNSWASS